jgi:hypothetical protein
MKKLILVFALATVGLALIPESSAAALFRRRQPRQCPPVVVCVPCPPAVVAPPGPPFTIKGKTYRLHDTIDQGTFKEKAATPPTPQGAGGVGNDTFDGKDRKAPKTTILVDAGVEEFATVAALIATLPTDEDMKQLSGITRDTMTRADAEKRNVRVTGFVYAFKKEDDNDYHIILGDPPGTGPPVYLNVEVSGIPVGGAAANRATLTTVRNDFKAAFQIGPTGPSKYKRPHDEFGQLSSVPVQITGSLFWDVDHPAGAVGPDDLKPKTAWEIHPVSAITFLQP